MKTLYLLTPLLILTCCGSENGAGQDVGPDSLISLPDDESPHSDLVEWWYYTGLLDAKNGEPYGFELTFFQAVITGVPVYMAHFAITDQNKGTFITASKTAFEDQRSDGPGFDLNIGGWTIAGHEGKDSIAADMSGYALDLRLEAAKPAVLHYGTGAMTIGSLNPLFYYSYTQMDVAGTLAVDGKESTVTGRGWMDHQWGDLDLDTGGWDWHSLRLDDQTEVMLFVVRGTDKNFVGGTFVDAEGGAVELKEGDFTVSATGQWKSEQTQAVYPIGWTIQIPTLGLDVTVDPVMEDQEVNHSLFGTPIYWEGLCAVSGTRQGQAITGHAYVELTNYDRKK